LLPDDFWRSAADDHDQRTALTRVKAVIREIEPDEVEIRLSEVTSLDVREPDESEQDALPRAVHLPRGNLEFQVDGRIPDKSQPVVVCCAGGGRSAFAAKTLTDLGYSDVASMIGGFNKWKDEARLGALLHITSAGVPDRTLPWGEGRRCAAPSPRCGHR